MSETCSTCERCDNRVSGHVLLCQQCYDDDAAYDDDANDCANCNGEGFVSHCFTEYACIHPDEGCAECMRPCDWCTPLKPAELAERAALQQVVADALHQPKEGGHG